MIKKWYYVLLWIIIASCSQNSQEKKSDNLEGELIIFHAGSVTVPVKEVIAEFNIEYPNIKVLTEIAGSVECARKISDLYKPCDIFISADYKVIEKMLFPDYANWIIQFASNEMVVAFNDKSLFANTITDQNWTNIVSKSNVEIGRSDPNSDPCGYRTIHALMLAENFYKIPGFANKIVNQSAKNIRPKEVDLLALLETNNIDYLFIYKSVAVQHKLKYIELPDEINLSNPNFKDNYSTVFTTLKGKTPSELINQQGEAIIYGLTMPKSGQNQNLAKIFLQFLLNSEKGLKIFDKEGQKPIKPKAINFRNVPDELKKMLEEN